MFKKLFGKRPTEDTVLAPVTGDLVEITEVPDPTFSQKMMGDGVAIKPTKGEVVSPVKGKIVQLFPTKHAVGIESESGVEYLIHIGLETVSLNGEGFEAHVNQGDKVSAGDLLISFDLDVIAEKAESTITPVVITNDVTSIDSVAPQSVDAGNTQIMTVVK
ncbi:glucose PTS transporter subunit IIA [Aquibacillus albus]|uniref:PTS system glucose-specific IIA component n=1 Tax=Aquibacillus albus TaxID=1168171 RepID=A0ABS2N2X2_9BACI|nr:PTS system glucose-specific IIA component [Aquibacillus albus]